MLCTQAGLLTMATGNVSSFDPRFQITLGALIDTPLTHIWGPLWLRAESVPAGAAPNLDGALSRWKKASNRIALLFVCSVCVFFPGKQVVFGQLLASPGSASASASPSLLERLL